VLEKTDYPNLELLIVNNRSDDPQTLKYLEQISLYQGVEVIPYDAQFKFFGHCQRCGESGFGPGLLVTE